MRLAALAREVKPHRTFEKRREPKAVKRSNNETHDGRATARHAAAGAVAADDAVAGRWAVIAVTKQNTGGRRAGRH